MTKMTVTEGLSRLKTLDKRIEKLSSRNRFIGFKLNGKVNMGLDASSIQSEYDSLISLMDQRAAIKAKITASNASTEVTIGSKTMKVAEAIEFKTSIEAKKELLNSMRAQYGAIIRKEENFEDNISREIDEKVSQVLGNQKKVDASDNTYKMIAEQVRSSKVFEVIDPLNLADKIKQLEEEIEDFESNVDVALTISNSTTFIEV